jgi:hypothetical protein
MELTGALWNPLERHKTLELRRSVDKYLAKKRASHPRQLSNNAPDRSQETVKHVLEVASKPMRVAEIHKAVEQELGRPVVYQGLS